jgi:hypothetical protein
LSHSPKLPFHFKYNCLFSFGLVCMVLWQFWLYNLFSYLVEVISPILVLFILPTYL